MSCVKNETEEANIRKLYKETERKIDNVLENQLAAMSNSRKCSLDFETVESELYERYKSSFGSDDEGSFTQEVLFTNFDGCDDYESFIENINNDKSAPVKLEGLHKLLECPVIDVTHKSWNRLSKNLQYCLISTNDEVFSASIKMHFKVILFPESSCEGFLSLVQGLELIFNNRCFLNKHFVANSKLQNRAVVVVKILLKTENFILKNLVQSKLSVFDEFLVTFFMLVCRHEESSTLFEILCFLDSKAKWFCNLCDSLQTRNNVLKKCVNIVKIALAIFIGQTSKMTRGGLQSRTATCKQCHAMCIIKNVLKYEKGRALFPIKLSYSTNVITINQLFYIAITRVKEPQTKSEIKQLLVHFLEDLSHSFDNGVIIKLLEPFKSSSFNTKQSYQTVVENTHIIHILKVLCSRKSINLLCGYYKNKYSKYKQLYSTPTPSPLQIISDLTISCLRHFINICEQEHQVKEIIIELLHCCKCLYALHPVTLLICCPDKLICCIRDFYEATGNYKVNLHYKLDLSEILGFFFTNYPIILKNLSNKLILLNEILNCTSEQFLLLIPVIANDDEGYEILKNNAAKITGAYLERIWLEEDSIWEENFEEVLNKFLIVIQAVSLNFKAFEAFVTSENELTLVDGDAKPVTLTELLEAAINSREVDICACYVALRVLKILVVNSDIAAYLNFTYHLQDNLENFSQAEFSSLTLDITKTLNFNSINISRDNSALKRRNKLSNLQQFLNKTRSGIHDNNWLTQARKAFKTTIQTIYNVHLIADLTEHIAKFRKVAQFWREECSEEYAEICFEEHCVVKKLVKLGITTGLLAFPAQCEENLLNLLQQFYVSLNVRKKKGFVGFPWIVGVVFVICSGNIEKSKKVITMILYRYLSIFWPDYANDDGFNEYFYQQIMVTVEDNCFGVNTVLRTAGISAVFIAKRWLQQCFLNVLQIEEICSFLMLCILFPMEYTVACIAAMFKHIKPHLFELAQNSQLHQIFEATTLVDFRIGNYLPFIENLSKQYKTFFCY